MKKVFLKILSFILTLLTVFSISVPSFATIGKFNDEPKEEEIVINPADKIVEIARAQKGFYESTINEFTTWYYGFETEASWCTIFVSWCGDQVGALGTAIPKRATCESMKIWFERRNRYYPASSDYIPQKGDIVFLNTAVDGTDNIHHVEIVTESGFIKTKEILNIKCIGGNTSDINYNGSEYVTEKVRPVDGSRATVVGYARPAYEKCNRLIAKTITFNDDHKLSLDKYIYAKMLELLARIQIFNKSLHNITIF